MKLVRTTLIVLLSVALSLPTFALRGGHGGSRGRPTMHHSQSHTPKKSHTAGSHDGHYEGGHGSSHKGGHYKNSKTGNHYRDRKHGTP
jgi:hypothetical protein